MFQYYPLLQESTKYQPLKDDVLRKAIRLAQEGSSEQQMRVFNHNLRLVFFTITKYKFEQMDRQVTEDMIMILSNHLYNIVLKYKYEGKNKFNTFAVFCLKNRAISFLQKENTYQARFRNTPGYRREKSLQESTSLEYEANHIWISNAGSDY